MNYKNVVIIDDEKDILELFKIFLAPITGVRFHFFESYQEAKDFLFTNPQVQLVVCDFNLGEKLGSDLYKELKDGGVLPMVFSYCTGDSSIQWSNPDNLPVLLKPMTKGEIRSFIIKHL